MQEYDVYLREFCDGEWLDEIVFECSADDLNHAEEQALDAYPNCVVLSVAIAN
jgi:hypothetical protein